MTNIQNFILTLIEMIAMMFLWNSLMKEKRDFRKYIFAIVSTTFIVRLSELLGMRIESIAPYVYIILLMSILFKKRIDEVLVEFGIITIISMAFQIIIMGMTYIFADYVSLFVRGIIINLSLLAASISINHFVPIESIYIKYKGQIGRAYLFLANIIFYILLLKFIREINNELFWNNIWYIALITLTFLFFNITFLINNIKYQEQKKVVETYNKYSPVMANLMDDIKRKQHDFKNHIGTIYGIIQTSDEKTIKNILEGYMKPLVASMMDSDNILQVKNHIIGAIIYNKVCEAHDNGIVFKYEVENSVIFNLKEFELSEVINNMLDNAFEATIKNERNKFVTLKIYDENENHIIEVKNTFLEENIKFRNKFFKNGFSTKEESGHGYGLYSIKKIVESYKGNIQLFIENDLIVLQILFK